MTITTQEAIADNGAETVYKAACAAMEGDYSRLAALGIECATLGDVFAVQTSAFKAMGDGARARDQMEANAELVKRGRPALPTDQVAKPRAIRLNDSDDAELKRRGMDALREWLRTPQ